MEFKELKDFYQMHYIGIRKLLNSSYDVSYPPKKDSNRYKKKEKISHDDIKGLPGIAPISVKFAMRYSELVERGKIIIVKDEFGSFQTYVNPRLIMETINEENFKEEVDKIREPFYDISLIAVKYFQKKYLEKKLSEIEETKRILNHFKCNETIDYVKSLSRTIKQDRERDAV